MNKFGVNNLPLFKEKQLQGGSKQTSLIRVWGLDGWSSKRTESKPWSFINPTPRLFKLMSGQASHLWRLFYWSKLLELYVDLISYEVQANVLICVAKLLTTRNSLPFFLFFPFLIYSLRLLNPPVNCICQFKSPVVFCYDFLATLPFLCAFIFELRSFKDLCEYMSVRNWSPKKGTFTKFFDEALIKEANLRIWVTLKTIKIRVSIYLRQYLTS